MNKRLYVNIIMLLSLAVPIYAKPSVVLWNNKSPCSFGDKPEKGEYLKKEIPDFHKDFRLQLGWKMGKVCGDPNELLRKDPNDPIAKEIILTKTIISKVLKPQIVNLESINDKFLVLPNVPFEGGKEDALVVRFKKDKYIIKIMKKKSAVFITVRPVSGEVIDIKKLSEEIFNVRILPVKWEKPLYFEQLKRKSKVLSSGMWAARDTFKIDSSGNIIDVDSHIPAMGGPIGMGLYKRIDFYTNRYFVCYKIIGGPRSTTGKKHQDIPPKKEGKISRKMPYSPFGPPTEEYDPNGMPYPFRSDNK